MSCSPSRKMTTAVVGTTAVVLLCVVLLLAPGGAEGGIRTVLGLLAGLLLPAWLIGELVGKDDDPIAPLVVGLVVLTAFYALSGFISYELDLRVATAVYAVPLFVLVALTTVLGVITSSSARVRVAPLGVFLLLSAAAVVGAMVTHLALPAAPVESTFSLQSSAAIVTPKTVTVTVTVSRIRSDTPVSLELSVWNLNSTTVATASTTVVHLKVLLPQGALSCPKQVRVLAQNGAFLSPPIVCVGW